MLAFSPGRAQAFGCRNVPYCLLAATVAAACPMTRIAAIMGHGPRLTRRTHARKIRDFGNTLRHHDVDRQRRELSELLDESEVGEAGYKNSVSTGIGISLCTLSRFI
jgi:hypothetical protein